MCVVPRRRVGQDGFCITNSSGNEPHPRCCTHQSRCRRAALVRYRYVSCGRVHIRHRCASGGRVHVRHRRVSGGRVRIRVRRRSHRRHRRARCTRQSSTDASPLGSSTTPAASRAVNPTVMNETTAVSPSGRLQRSTRAVDYKGRQQSTQR